MADEVCITHGPFGPGPATLILVAYLGNPANAVSVSELAAVLQIVHEGCGDAAVTSRPDAPTPAVPVKDSVGPDFLICLEDGAKLKMLKRYLRSQHDMSPEEYRAKWGLPADYPMVAPDYSERRSALAKRQGLGRKAPPKLPLKRRNA